jgi:hypothetical protein
VRGFKHISHICGDKLSKKQVSIAITLQNTSPIFLVGIIILLCAKFHPNPLGNETTKVAIDKHTHIHTCTDKLLTNQVKHPHFFWKFNYLQASYVVFYPIIYI